MIDKIFIDDFHKNLIFSDKPSNYIHKLDRNALELKMPELYALIEVPQNPEWHPEGDVFEHTMLVIDQAAVLKTELNTEDENIILMYSALCHDFGKPETTFIKDNKIVSPNHELKGDLPTRSFLKNFNFSEYIIEEIVKVVKEHLRPATLFKNKENVSNAAILRLLSRVNPKFLLLTAKADHFGRTTPDAIAKEFPAGDWLKNRFENVKIRENNPKPILNGHEIIALGFKPGKIITEIKKYAAELHIQNSFIEKNEIIGKVIEKFMPILK